MPSRTYELMADALTSRRQVLCDYDGYPRELCPVERPHHRRRVADQGDALTERLLATHN